MRGFFKTLLVLLGIGISIALIRDTRYQGQDFEVFWRTARHWSAGESIYSLSRDGAMAFKYPPWILPFFLPFSLLPLELAKWIWGGLEVVGLWATVAWLFRRGGVNLTRLALLVAAYWGVWAVHALDGQVSLVMMGAVIWLWELRQRLWVRTLAWILLSTKIFSILGVFAFSPRDARRFALTVLSTLGLVAVLLVSIGQRQPVRTMGLIENWRRSAISGAEQFGGEKIYGRENQGAPALMVRLFHEEKKERPELKWALVFFLAWAIVLIFTGRNSPPHHQLVMALAGIPVVHPLSWVHSFIWGLPLMALFLEQLHRRGGFWARFSGWVGVAIFSLGTGRLLGGPGDALELSSAKSLVLVSFFLALIIQDRSEHFLETMISSGGVTNEELVGPIV